MKLLSQLVGDAQLFYDFLILEKLFLLTFSEPALLARFQSEVLQISLADLFAIEFLLILQLSGLEVLACLGQFLDV